MHMEAKPAMIKILYADDIEFLRNGITADLSREEDFEVTSCNLDIEETMRIYREKSPDVLLLDVMNDTNIHEGLDIARKLQNEPARTEGRLKVLLLTIFREDDESIKSALEAGLADDVVTKPATSDAIINKIKTVVGN